MIKSESIGEMEDKQIWRLREIADKYDLNYQWLFRCVHSGELKAVKRGGTWLVTRDELRRFFGEK